MTPGAPRPKPVREPMRSVDKAWLEMDTPTNLMIINGVMLFEGVIEYERLCALIEERLVARYARFRQRIVNLPGPGGYVWEDDPYFDLRCHMRHVALPAPGDKRTLQSFMSDLISEALEPNRPLWRFYLIENFQGGSAIFGRLHHAIADGIALVQVLLSLTDEHEDADDAPPAPPPPKRSGSVSPFSLLRGAIRRGGAVASSLAGLSLHEGLQTAAHPQRLIETAYTAGLLSVTGAAILAKLLLIPPDNDSAFKGALGAYKRVVWSEPILLDEVKRIGRLAGATVNDLLVAAVAGALRRYMLDHDSAVDIRAMVPVNLRDLSKPPTSLGNEFALVYLSLPLQAESPAERLRVVKQQMDLLKQSPEPLIIYELLNIIGMFPGPLADMLTTWFSSKASAVLTNVPGPRAPIYVCGVPLRRLMFWVPQSGRIGLGISIISYRGEVTLGIMVDEGLVAEPEAILASFQAEFAALADAFSPEASIGDAPHMARSAAVSHNGAVQAPAGFAADTGARDRQ